MSTMEAAAAAAKLEKKKKRKASMEEISIEELEAVDPNHSNSSPGDLNSNKKTKEKKKNKKKQKEAEDTSTSNSKKREVAGKDDSKKSTPDEKKKKKKKKKNDQEEEGTSTLKKTKEKKRKVAADKVDTNKSTSNEKKRKKKKKKEEEESTSRSKKTEEVAEKADAKKSTPNEKKRSADGPETSLPKKKQKVRLAEVEFVPPTDEVFDEDNMWHGRRFHPDEDQMIRDAVQKYIETKQLGDDGLNMVLHCQGYPQIKHCWKEISLSLPWRPLQSVYNRAHIIFERSENRGFTNEEIELIRRFHAEHGPRWTELAKLLGKQKFHVKDAWRRIRLKEKRGMWSQDEYQNLFDLVNLDLRLKAFEEKKKNCMLRENIAWEAISDKLSQPRSMANCCHKWYDQLASPLVRQGVWADTDDYYLLDALQKQDACCVEDVDWDCLLERRDGEVCRKRWSQMVRHLGSNKEMPFLKQVDVLAQRYCLDMVQYRTEVD